MYSYKKQQQVDHHLHHNSSKQQENGKLLGRMQSPVPPGLVTAFVVSENTPTTSSAIQAGAGLLRCPQIITMTNNNPAVSANQNNQPPHAAANSQHYRDQQRAAKRISPAQRLPQMMSTFQQSTTGTCNGKPIGSNEQMQQVQQSSTSNGIAGGVSAAAGKKVKVVLRSRSGSRCSNNHNGQQRIIKKQHLFADQQQINRDSSDTRNKHQYTQPQTTCPITSSNIAVTHHDIQTLNHLVGGQNKFKSLENARNLQEKQNAEAQLTFMGQGVARITDQTQQQSNRNLGSIKDGDNLGVNNVAVGPTGVMHQQATQSPLNAFAPPSDQHLVPADFEGRESSHGASVTGKSCGFARSAKIQSNQTSSDQQSYSEQHQQAPRNANAQEVWQAERQELSASFQYEHDQVFKPALEVVAQMQLQLQQRSEYKYDPTASANFKSSGCPGVMQNHNLTALQKQDSTSAQIILQHQAKSDENAQLVVEGCDQLQARKHQTFGGQLQANEMLLQETDVNKGLESGIDYSKGLVGDHMLLGGRSPQACALTQQSSSNANGCSGNAATTTNCCSSDGHNQHSGQRHYGKISNAASSCQISQLNFARESSESSNNLNFSDFQQKPSMATTQQQHVNANNSSENKQPFEFCYQRGAGQHGSMLSGQQPLECIGGNIMGQSACSPLDDEKRGILTHCPQKQVVTAFMNIDNNSAVPHQQASDIIASSTTNVGGAETENVNPQQQQQDQLQFLQQSLQTSANTGSLKNQIMNKVIPLEQSEKRRKIQNSASGCSENHFQQQAQRVSRLSTTSNKNQASLGLSTNKKRMTIKSMGSSSGKKQAEKVAADVAMFSRSKKKQQLLSNKNSQSSGLKINSTAYASHQAAPKVIQKKIIKLGGGRKSETSQEGSSSLHRGGVPKQQPHKGINQIRSQQIQSANRMLVNNGKALTTKPKEQKQARLGATAKVQMNQHQKASTYLDDEPMAEENDEIPAAAATATDLDQMRQPLEESTLVTNFADQQQPHIMDLLGIDRDHDDEELRQNNDGNNVFNLQQQQQIPSNNVNFALSFHPAAMSSSANDFNDFEDEQDEEMIKPVNPNKHIQNYEDGGRRRKLRHVSKIDCFKRGKDAINPFCKDLFGVKQLQHQPMQSEKITVAPEILPTPQKVVERKVDFSQIDEEKIEESPPVKNTEDKSMLSESGFKLQATVCSQDNIMIAESRGGAEEQQTQAQSQVAQIDSLGIEDELFQEDDSATMLPTLDFTQAVSQSAACNPIDGQTLANLIRSQAHPVIIVDCRFDYEFSYGHIKGAINIDNPEQLESMFLRDLGKLRQMMTARTILVFHCEFSQRRGPSLWKTLRELDRNINVEKYPKLFYPEMYVLEKGFSSFFERFPDLCVGGYKCQDGDKLEKQRVRSMQRDLRCYNILDHVVQLKKSASYGNQQILPTASRGFASTTSSQGNTNGQQDPQNSQQQQRVQPPFLIKSSAAQSQLPRDRALSNNGRNGARGASGDHRM